MKKNLICLLLLISMFSFASDKNVNTKVDNSIKKLEKTLNENIEKNNKLNEINKAYESEILKNKYAVVSGKAAALLNISTVFDYYQTSVYEVFTRPNYTTTIKLNKDEELVYVGGGNTENWDLDEVKGGNDNSQMIFVKPLFENEKTNLVIVTNKRTYHIYLQSTNKEYNPLVEWKYSYEQNMQFLKDKLAKEKSSEIKLEVSNVNELDFNYKYNKNSKIAPDQVYNDGVKTIINLKKTTQEVPVVYIKTEDNQLSQINYRIIDNKIIIDKVVDKIQLILGKEILDIYK